MSVRIEGYLIERRGSHNRVTKLKLLQKTLYVLCTCQRYDRNANWADPFSIPATLL